MVGLTHFGALDIFFLRSPSHTFLLDFRIHNNHIKSNIFLYIIYSYSKESTHLIYKSFQNRQFDPTLQKTGPRHLFYLSMLWSGPA